MPQQQKKGLLGSLLQSLADPFQKFGSGLGNAVSTVINKPLVEKSNQNLLDQQDFVIRRAKELRAQGREKDANTLLSVAGDLNKTASGLLNTQEQQQKKGLSDTVRGGLGVASWMVPFGKGANLLTKALLPGAVAGGLSAASQDNSTIRSTATGATGGAIMSGGLAKGGDLLAKALGRTGKALTQKLPEQLMSGVLKEPLRDTRAALKGGESLASQAIKRGIKGGSDESIYKSSVSQLNQFEDELQKALTSSREMLDIEEIKKAADPLIRKYSKSGNLAAVNNITKRLEALEIGNGKKIPVAAANEIKRTLYDEARNGYGQLASENIEGVKAIAKAFKEGIAKKVPGVDKINKELSFHGKVADSLIDKMARSGRNNLLGLTDSILTAGGIASVGPAGLAVPAIKNTLGSTAGKTYLANILSKAGNTSSGVTKAASSVTSNPLLRQILGQTNARTGATVANSIVGEQAPQSVENTKNNETSQSPFEQGAPPEGFDTADILSQLKQYGISDDISQQFATKLAQRMGTSQGQSSGGMTITPQMVMMAQLQLAPQEAAKIKAAFDIQEKNKPKSKDNVENAISEMERLYGAGTKDSLSRGQITTGLGGILGGVNQKLKASTNQDYADRLNSYKQISSLTLGILNKAREAGALNEGEYQTLIQNIPNETTSEKVAQNWFQNVRRLLGNRGQESGEMTEEDALALLQQQGVL